MKKLQILIAFTLTVSNFSLLAQFGGGNDNSRNNYYFKNWI